MYLRNQSERCKSRIKATNSLQVCSCIMQEVGFFFTLHENFMLKIGNTCAYLKFILEEGISKPMGRRKQEMVYVLFPLCSSGRAGELEWGLWQMQDSVSKFTLQRGAHPRDNSGVVTLLNVPIGQWEWGLWPKTPDKPYGAIHAPALPEGSDRGLETSELYLCLAASPSWPCMWGKHSWESFLHKSCTQEPHFQTLLSGLPTWDTCPPGNHSFCLPASVCKVCTRENSNPPAAL